MPENTSDIELDVARSLVGRGFFPETLPPCFTSSALSELLARRRPEINAARLSRRPAAKPIRYSSTKNNGARRIFSTPHPLNYLFISEFIKNHWTEIKAFIEKNSTISASAPEPQLETEIRSVRITPFNELDLLVHKTIKHSAYILKTDIAQFYPSVYTHSIPWAFHGKDKSKDDRRPQSKEIFFNELDYHLRNCQDGQTHGLFVGPDAARIISEILLAAVDERFTRAANGLVIGAVRYVDDYHIGVASEADAASVLAILNDELNAFELSTNDIKTKIAPTSLPTGDTWPFVLNRLANDFLEIDALPEARIAELINRALVLTAEQRSQSPIKLLLRLFDKFRLEIRDEFSFVEAYLMRFVHHFAHAIDYICMIVGARVLAGEPIDRAAWAELIGKEVVRYARLRQHHEVAWLIWLAIISGLRVDEGVMEAVLRTENAHLCSMLVAGYRETRLQNQPSLELPSKLEMVSDKWLIFHEAALAGLCEKSRFEDDELDVHAELVANGQGYIDFSLGEEKLKTGASVINGVRFGYDLDDDLPEVRPRRLFVPSTQDF